MKKCPFCAEDIQDVAIVCKHCGRDLTVSAAPGAVAPKPNLKQRSLWRVIGFCVVGLFVLAVVVAVIGSLTEPQTSPPTARASTSSEPDEPCRVEAPAAARAAAQNWCQGGVFTLVNVSNDVKNFVVLLQF